MLIPVSYFLAVALAVLSYSQGQGGPVAGLVFFFTLFLGIHIKNLGRAFGWTCRTLYRGGNWFFRADLSEVAPLSLCGVAVILILVATLSTGFGLGFLLRENSRDSSYVCDTLKSESLLEDGQLKTSHTRTSASVEPLNDRAQELCAEVREARFYSEGASLSYYFIAALALVLAFAMMAAQSFKPSDYTATLISAFVLASQITFFGETALWIVGGLIIGLIVILVFLRLLKRDGGRKPSSCYSLGEGYDTDADA